MNRKSFNQKGASLIEVMIMSGAMVAMMAGFMSLMSHEAKNVSYLEDKLSRVGLENELRMHFSNADFCKDFLGGISAPSKDQTKEIMKLLTQVVQKAALEKVFQKRGNKTVYDQLEIKKISLEGSDLTGPNSSGVLDLMFYPERMRKGGGPASLQPVKITTAVNVKGGLVIDSCSVENVDGESCRLNDLASSSFRNRKTAYYCDVATRTPVSLQLSLTRVTARTGNTDYVVLPAGGGTVNVPNMQMFWGTLTYNGGTITQSFNVSGQCAEGTWMAQNFAVPDDSVPDCNPFPPDTSCFIAGTMVTLKDGSQKPIESLVPGDELLGMDGNANRVVRLEVVPLGARFLYSLNGEKAFVTREHPFLTPTGWKSISPEATRRERPDLEFDVQPLNVGDFVLRDNRWIQLESIKSVQLLRSEMVYNPLLDGDHTYEADGYRVHNKSGDR